MRRVGPGGAWSHSIRLFATILCAACASQQTVQERSNAEALREAQLSARIRAAQSPEQLASAVAEAERFLAALSEKRRTGHLLIDVGAQWLALRRPEDSATTYRRVLREFPRERDAAYAGLAAVYWESGDPARLVSTLDEALGTLNSPPESLVRVRAALFEANGDWRGACAVWEGWNTIRPLDGPCGVRDSRPEYVREMALALCKSRTGAVDESLRYLEHIMEGRVWAPLPVALFAEISVRAGRLATADPVLAKKCETAEWAENRQDCAAIRAVAASAAQKDVDGVLEALRPVATPPERLPDLFVSAGRLIDDVGPGAISPLTDAVARGDRAAYLLAGRTHFKALLPALRSRVASERQDRGARATLEQSIRSLELLGR